MKRAIYPLYVPADESKVKPILQALRERNVKVRDPKAAAGKKDALLLFLSKDLSADGPAADQFIRLNAGRELVIPVNLDGCTPPEVLQSALMARHGLDGTKYGPQELAERIAKAAAGEKRSRLPLVLSLLGVAALLLVGGLIAWNLMGKPDLKTVFAQATDTPAPTPEPTAVPTATPAPTPTPPLPDNTDITLEQLESVFELIVVGDSFNYYTGDEEWMKGSGNARVGVEHVANRGFDNGQARWYSTEDGHAFALYDWGDLAFLPYMKNLTLLTLVDVQGTLPDLSGLKKLNCVEVLDCDIDDISGLQGAAKLLAFNYSGPARDLSFLNGVRTLTSMNLTLYGSGQMDLSAFGPMYLQDLTVIGPGSDGRIDLSGLNRCRQLERVRLSDLPLTDLACLSKATGLRELELDGLERLTSLNGLDAHNKLTRIWVDNCFSLSNIDALTGCTALSQVELNDCRISDLTGLSGARSLRELELRNMGTLRSFHGLEEHTSLKNIEVNDLQGLTDISALGSCTNLESLNMHEVFSLGDISPVVGLPKLRDLQIYGSQLNNVDFLWDIQNKDYFSFGIAEVPNWEGLAAIEKYSFLNITDRNGSALPYVENATVTDMQLWNRGGRGNQSEGLDLSRLPKVTNKLELFCVTSLEGLDQPNVRILRMDDCPYLTSLSGMEGMDRLVRMEVCNCPRLTDWSALNGRRLDEINLEALFTLPDFGTFSAREVSLTTIYDLTDLSCFQNYQQDGYRIMLMDVDGVTDLSPLYHLHGTTLQIPAHLKEQAQAMVDSGLLNRFEVTYPEGWWEPIEPHIELLSLEEIDTLPSALLSRITELQLAGDVIVPLDGSWIEDDWGTNPPTLYLHYDGEEERIPVAPGTLVDFARLSKLTGLKRLTIWGQPELTSLEGIQGMSDLRDLNLRMCPALTDGSPVFTVQSLEELYFWCTGISSIQGIQNLYALRQLDLNDNPVEDLSPLGACGALERATFQVPFMTFEEFAALPEGVRRHVHSLSIAGGYVYDGGPWWFEEDWVTDPPRLYLHNNETDERLPLVEGAVANMAELAALLPNVENLDLYGQPLTTLDGIENFSQLWRLTMEECRQVEDFSALWNMSSLGDVSLRNEPIDSLEGIENLKHLVSLSLSGTNVKDFSPLARVDYGYSTSEENQGRGFNLALDVMDADKLTYEDYAPLEAVPIYWSLNMNNVPVELWYDHVMGKELHELSCHRCGMSNEQLKAFVEAHPMLEQLTLTWNPQLTDLSCLLELKELRRVQVSQDMKKAIASLGEGYGFELNIEN